MLPLRSSEDTEQEHREAAEVGSALRPPHLEGTSGKRGRGLPGSNHPSLPSLDPRDPSRPSSSSVWQHWFPKRPPVQKYRKTRVKNHPNPRGKGRKGRARAAVPSEAGEELRDGSELQEPAAKPPLDSAKGTSSKPGPVFPWQSLWRRAGGLQGNSGCQVTSRAKRSRRPLFLPQFLSAPTAPNGRGESGRGTGLWEETGPVPRLEGAHKKPLGCRAGLPRDGTASCSCLFPLILLRIRKKSYISVGSPRPFSAASAPSALAGSLQGENAQHLSPRALGGFGHLSVPNGDSAVGV